MGLRALVVIIAIVLVIYLLRRTFHRMQAPKERQIKSSVDMVRCEVCGTHVPKPEALAKNDRYYCSKQHRDQADD